MADEENTTQNSEDEIQDQAPAEPEQPTSDSSVAETQMPDDAPATETPATSETSNPIGLDQAELDALMQAQGMTNSVPKAEASTDQTVDDIEAEMAAAIAAESAAGVPDDIAAEMAAAIVAESVGQTSGETAETAEPKGPALIGGAVNHISTDGAATFDLPPLDVPGAGQLSAMDLLDDVELNVKIELGRTEMYIEDVLQLGMGSVVELDKLAGDPVDIFVNEQLIARGEVLVLNDSFCVRINDILTPVPETEA